MSANTDNTKHELLCPLCYQGFRNRSDLINHLTITHLGLFKTLVCPCGVRIKDNADSMSGHIVDNMKLPWHAALFLAGGEVVELERNN